MDYKFESLDPERFQQFCQSLLALSFPKLQCFPVGQRDGGRDATTYYLDKATDEFAVFQVKFVRNPLSVVDPHKWLTDIMEEEAPKIKVLIPKGAKEYYLLTNIPGTAFPEAGSIDSLHKVLNDTLEIPSQCWWRDDLNRRTDAAWDLKWMYPEILSGVDVLRLIVEAGLTEDNERRTAAIRAFIRDQYDRDKEVRFKQIELQNNLLDLFIDVPITTRGGQSGQWRREYKYMKALMHSVSAFEEMTENREEYSVGAATAFLDPILQTNISRAVLEGAPGQGKSTIAQYVCQIHRMRILGEDVNIPPIPARHRNNPIRIPFKIDLRDLSAWLSRVDPFSSDDTHVVPEKWHKSIESFLAAQVRYYSGGIEFDIADFHAVSRLSPILLVFDGLDEVADITKRQEVVEEISMGVNRIAEIALSLQAIVTSRPAAFANSPGLPEANYCYFELHSITKGLIDDYAVKWLRAKKLHGKEAADVKKILKEKLDQPHLRELARNPMQLAILLSLIHTRGSSLPDKRTALYDSYVELFFSREAEKSAIVREHRDLLIEIHCFLAWVLHSEAETSGNRGSVSVERLQRLVSSYLADEQRDTSLTQRLFTGMVERVVALVSRVQGTFEFEVQPLREYFAARHLYNTAPYSPPGAEKKGTLPDRFDALARNFYWLNVTRFYAGCYSKGELPSLVDRLEELSREDGYRHTSHPQALAAILLSDWVFAQHPKSMRKVVALILDGLGLRYILAYNGSHFRRRNAPLVLPRQCGNEELIDHCFSLLRNDIAPDYATGIIELLRSNASGADIKTRWMTEIKKTEGEERTLWIAHGLYLGSLSELDSAQLTEIMADAPYDAERLNRVLRSNQASFCEETVERFDATVEHIFERDIIIATRFPRSSSVLERLLHSLNAKIYSLSFHERQPFPLGEVWRHRMSSEYFGQEKADAKTKLDYENAWKAEEVIAVSRKELQQPAAEWATNLEPWDRIVEAARALFGSRWLLIYLANISAGIRSKQAKYDEYSDLFDHSQSLCKRVRYARLRAGNSTWWMRQVELAKTELERMFAALVLLTWASPTVLTKNIEIVDVLLREMPFNDWRRLSRALNDAVRTIGRSINEETFDINSFPRGLSERSVAAVGTRATAESSEDIYKKYLHSYEGTDPAVLEFSQRVGYRIIYRDPTVWKQSLAIIAKSYSKGIIVEPYYMHQYFRRGVKQLVPNRIAEEIVEHADKYPSELVSISESVCRGRLMANIVPVGKIAEKNRWFTI